MGIELGDMWVRYKADVSDLSSKMSQAKSDMSSANDSAQSSSGGIIGAFMNAGSGVLDFGAKIGLALNGLQTLGQGAVSLGVQLLGPASAAENTQASFANLLGSTQAASNELGKLNDFAAKTQFKTQDIDNAAASMIAFKTPTKDIIPELTAVGDSLTAVGKGTPAEMQGVVDILGKMGVQGKLTQGDITQLGAHGINAMQAIEDGSGLSAKSLEKLIKNGTLPAKDAIADLTKGIEKNPVYSGGMAKQSNTLSGLMSTMSSNWDQVLAGFGSPIIKNLEPILNNIGNVLTSPSFKSFAGDVGQKIVSTVQSIGDNATKAGQFLSSNFGKPLDDLKTAVAPLVKNFSDWATKSDALGKSVTGLGGGLKNVVTSIAGGVENFAKFVKFLQDGGTPADVLKASLIGIGGAFAAIQIGSFIAAVPALVAGFLAWGASAWTAAAGTIAATWPIILIGVGVALVIAGIVLAVQHWGEIAHWLQGVWSAIAGFFEWLWGKISGFFVGVGQWFHDRFTAAYDAVTSAMGNVGKWFGDRWKDIQGAFDGVKNFFIGVGQSIWNGIKSGLNWVIGGIDDFINFVNGIHLSIPAVNVGPVHTPGLDLSLPHIPTIAKLAAGGIVPPGEWAVAGDPGPHSELVYGGSSGASVYSHSQSTGLIASVVAAVLASGASSGGGSSETHVHTHIYLDGRELTESVSKHQLADIRAQGGVRR